LLRAHEQEPVTSLDVLPGLGGQVGQYQGRLVVLESAAHQAHSVAAQAAQLLDPVVDRLSCLEDGRGLVAVPEQLLANGQDLRVQRRHPGITQDRTPYPLALGRVADDKVAGDDVPAPASQLLD